MSEMTTKDVREMLEILHDRLAFVLSDPSGEIFHGDDFERTFDSAIKSLEWR